VRASGSRPIAEEVGDLARALERRFDQRVLGDLAQPGPVLALGKRCEQAHVGEHTEGLVERSDEVLSLRHVHARLATDRGVDLPE
jgi:hypothetical protein